MQVTRRADPAHDVPGCACEALVDGVVHSVIGSLVQPEIWFSYFRMISKLPSVEPPSTIKYSRFGYPCARTERIVCSRYFPELKTGVTRDMRGHSEFVAPAGAILMSAIWSVLEGMLMAL